MAPHSPPPLLVTVAHTLRHCRLFATLDAQTVEAIAAMAESQVLPAGGYLFREGDPARGFYVLQRGAVNVHRVGPGGREQVIHVFGPGETFAEAAVAGRGGFPADARAVGPSTVLFIPRDPFLALIARRPRIALEMLGAMALHLRTLVDRLEDLTLRDVESRFAGWLVRRTDRGRLAEIEIDGTKRMLAAELGTTSETLSRTFARFTAEGILTVKGRRIRVVDPDALARRFQAAAASSRDERRKGRQSTRR